MCQFQVFGQPRDAELTLSRSVGLFTGRLGLGFAAPVHRLEVNGSVAITSNVGIGTKTPGYALHLARDSAAKPSTSTWTVSSDARLKEDIVPADLERCAQIVRSVPLKRFTWRDDVYGKDVVSDRSKLGWIAQDVELAFPKAVERSAAHGLEDCRALNTDQMLSAMYGCVQHILARLDKLEERA